MLFPFSNPWNALPSKKNGKENRNEMDNKSASFGNGMRVFCLENRSNAAANPTTRPANENPG